MKINGKKIEGPNEEIVVIPRNSGDIVFKARAVLSFDEFDKLCPLPVPPKTLMKGGGFSENVESPEYKKNLDDWTSRRTHWMILESLKATENLEWETVDASKTDTWENYQTELLSSGFSPMEQARIVQAVTSACGLNQDKIDEATKRFLAGQVAEPVGV